jgi:hypothetical protein
MGNITAQSIMEKAKVTLLDETNVRWTSPELLTHLNDGQRELVALKPDANTVNAVLTLVAGTRQSIPASGVQLFKIVRNMGMDGNTPGRAVTPASMETLDRTRPNWHAEAANAEVQHYMFDPRDPKTFYVTPPQPETPSRIEAVYAASPADVAIGAPINIDDIYATALYYFIMARAHAKETPGADTGKAAGYYNLFLGVLGLKAKAEDRSFARSPRPQQAAQVE